jgi:hypothetical protein
MYRTCRHIKPNGLRCESPALRGTYFCYFHSKLHSLGAEPFDKLRSVRLPTPEGPAAVLLSIAQIDDALINGRIDPKLAGQLLYSMQIASQHIESHRPSQVIHQVESMTTTPEGEELAPDEFVCDDDDDCEKCPLVETCDKWVYLNPDGTTKHDEKNAEGETGDDDDDDDDD